MKRTIPLFASAIALFTLIAPAQAHEEGQWIIRAGLGSVAPDSKNLDLSDAVDTITVEVDSGTSLTLVGTYMITKNWAFDVLAAWPFSHDINLVVNGDSGKIAETDHLPPTLSAQYHFSPDAKFQPYVGFGLNYTTFFSTDTVPALSDLGVELDLDDSFGLAVQLGADFEIDDTWLLNFDVRYISIETDATLGGDAIGTVVIDPWVYAINLGYRF